MDIESKRYRIRAAGHGQAEIIHKPSGRACYVDRGEAPSVAELAAMHERAFDQKMAALMA